MEEYVFLTSKPLFISILDKQVDTQ